MEAERKIGKNGGRKRASKEGGRKEEKVMGVFQMFTTSVYCKKSIRAFTFFCTKIKLIFKSIFPPTLRNIYIHFHMCTFIHYYMYVLI